VTTQLGTIAAALLFAASLAGAAQEAAIISISESDGQYSVEARFSVPDSPSTAREVLTDYANIPRFMRGVRRSVVREREANRVQVEQDAVSKFMLVSKTIHLVLDIDESENVIAFRDRSSTSFERYEGSWTICTRGTGTELTYRLSARPAFTVPGLVLRRLLTRDAGDMVDRLRNEIHRRATARNVSQESAVRGNSARTR
jgi:ribosome-associated toxin RatA of RatAB toxin-antitoxin module